MPLSLWITLASVRWTHGIECRVRFKTKTMPAPNSREMSLYRRVTSAILPQSTRSRIFFLSRADSFEYNNEKTILVCTTIGKLWQFATPFVSHFLTMYHDSSIFRFLIDRNYTDTLARLSTSLQFKLINFTLNFSEIDLNTRIIEVFKTINS